MYDCDPPAPSPTTKLHTSGVKGGGEGGGGDGEGGGGDGEGGGAQFLHTKPALQADGDPILHPCSNPVAPRSPIT